MNFKPCIDFFRKGKKILLTNLGSNYTRKLKLTGTKIPKFFQLKILHLDSPYGEEESEDATVIDQKEDRVPKTSFQIWSHVFHFPFVSKRNVKKLEKYRSVEEIIKNYLEVNLNREWINYPIEKTDVFDDHEIFGGVPDGEELDEAGNVISILEIKTITRFDSKIDDEIFSSVPLVYQLQLALYLYLRNIDVGYICVCYLRPENWENPHSIKLNSPLSRYSTKSKTFNLILKSWIPSIGDNPYSYELQEAYCNEFVEDNGIILLKIKIDLSKYKNLLEKLSEWFCNYRDYSPDMTNLEFSKFSSQNPMW